MTDKRVAEAQSAEGWDPGGAERRPAVKGARVIVSVAFSREYLELIAACAEQLGKSTSEFIRDAALDRANRSVGSARIDRRRRRVSSGPDGSLQRRRTTKYDRRDSQIAKERLAALGDGSDALVRGKELRNELDRLLA
ncbi:MAG: ribbon-helix-helix protein, CopG family [Chloroflexota bacterium]|nr:MAG: ribbon-helix-helix protein, CopG family [Chloroflexota bacterium]